MKRYAEYKESGVEWLEPLPDNWNTAMLKRFVVEHKQGYYTNEEYVDNGTKLLRITDIDDNSTVSFENCPYAQISDSDREYFKLEINDFVFARSGTIGRFGIIRTKENVAFASYLIRFRFIDNANTEFLKFYLFSDFFRNGLISDLHGGANKNIHAENIKNQVFILPSSLVEQKSISSFLDHKTSLIDNLIAKKEKQIELLKEERVALINHAVTKGLNPNVKMKDSGIEWLGEIPEHWVKTSIKHILANDKNSMVDGPFGSSINVATDYVESGIPVIRTININDDGFNSNDLRYMRREKYGELKRHSVKPGDILFSKVGTIGNVCILPSNIPEAILSTTGSCKISVNENLILNEYLKYLLQAFKPHFLFLASSNVQPFLNMTTIRNVHLPLPQIWEQNIILDFLKSTLSTVDTVLLISQNQINLLKEYRTALISEAVTGKIDVRDWNKN
jgi:type I restriction enzyme, S subunit